MISNTPAPLLFLTLCLLVPAEAAPAVEETRHELVPETIWSTTAYVRDSGVAGPVVVVIGGIHGNEPAGWRAAGQIRQWPLVQGKVVVIPRANEQGCVKFVRRTPSSDDSRSTHDLNRQFPDESGAGIERPLARALWELVASAEPDWLVDLHESQKYVFESTEEQKGLGNSLIIYPDAEAERLGALMVETASAYATSERYQWVARKGPIEGSLARAAAARLGCRAMIVETCVQSAMARRVRYHRLVMHRLLSELGMLPEGFSPDTFFADLRSKDGVLRVAIYNDKGASSARAAERCFDDDANTVAHRVSGAAIRGGALAQFDAVLFPGGSGSKQARSLDDSGREAVVEFVREGGGCIGICAGAYLVTSHYSWSLDLLNAKVIDTKHWARGKGEVELELTEAARELLDEEDPRVAIWYAQGPLLGPGSHEQLDPYEALATFRTEVQKEGVPGGVMPGTDAIARASFGAGRVVAFSPHPESRKHQRHYVLAALDWILKRRPVAADEDR